MTKTKIEQGLWWFIPLLAGIALTFSFAPFNYSYLAIVALVLVFFSWLDVSPGRAALRGFLFGLGLFGSGISWVYISIHDYGGASAIGATLLTVLVVAFWSLFPALTAYCSVLLSVKKTQRMVWIFPSCWIFIEYLRGVWFLNGFPWFQVAYTQLYTPLHGFIPVLGGYGSGFLLLLSSSLLLAGWRRLVAWHYVIAIVLLVWGSGAILQTQQWTQPIGQPIKVALVQGNVPQDQKWLPEKRIATLLSYRWLTEQNWDADLIIWPETAIPAYLSQVKTDYLDPLAQTAKEHDTVLLVSMPRRGLNNAFFNTVLALGAYEGRYDKNHLLPFGEYLPFQPFSGWVLSALNIHLGDFSSGGSQQTMLRVGQYSFVTSICYEDAFSEEARRQMPDAAFLVNVTNDAWFGESIEPYQHMQMAQMRALETGRYLVRTTNTGVTAITAPNGRLIAQAPLFKEYVLTGQIVPMGGATPFSQLGDHLIIGVLLVGTVMVVLVMRFSLK